MDHWMELMEYPVIQIYSPEGCFTTENMPCQFMRPKWNSGLEPKPDVWCNVLTPLMSRLTTVFFCVYVYTVLAQSPVFDSDVTFFKHAGGQRGLAKLCPTKLFASIPGSTD